MKYLMLFEQFAVKSINEDKDFLYKGYDCKIPYVKNRNSYSVRIYKENEYLAGVRGWMPLEDAIDYVKNFVNMNIGEKKSSFDNVSKPKELKKKMDGVSLGKEKKSGKYFVYTHRAASKSYDFFFSDNITFPNFIAPCSGNK